MIYMNGFPVEDIQRIKENSGVKRTPLKRKTPLRQKTPLKSSTSLQRKTPLNKVSKRQQQLNRKRSKFSKEQLELRPFCEAGPIIHQSGFESHCSRNAVELHEPILRSAGGSITDVNNSVAICRLCHSWIHNNVGESIKLGLIKSRQPHSNE